MKKTKEEIMDEVAKAYGYHNYKHMDQNSTIRPDKIHNMMERYKDQSTAPLIKALRDCAIDLQARGWTDDYPLLSNALKALQEAENGK